MNLCASLFTLLFELEQMPTMHNTTDSILQSLDCSDKAILPWLPYILQDFDELGSDAQLITRLIEKHARGRNSLSVLDAGCGNGAVSVSIARQFGYFITGVDAMPAFIEAANARKLREGVAHLCDFSVADARQAIKTTQTWHIILLCSVGPLFGDYLLTLTLLKPRLKKGGFIIIDDGYIADSNPFTHPVVQKRTHIMRQIQAARMTLIDEIESVSGPHLQAIHKQEYGVLEQRCQELIQAYPHNRELFTRFLDQQKREYQYLMKEISCSTMVLSPRE